MTGSLMNEKLKLIILKKLYLKRNSGERIDLIKILKKWEFQDCNNKIYKNRLSEKDKIKKRIIRKGEIKSTLTHLNKEWIWMSDITKLYSGKKHTTSYVELDGMPFITAKITQQGKEYYRKEFRDEIWKYWSLRLGVYSIIGAGIIASATLLPNQYQFDRSNMEEKEKKLQSTTTNNYYIYRDKLDTNQWQLKDSLE
jgi:hypothetical protein